MEDGLTLRHDDLMTLMSGGGLGEVLKPLTQEIHLFDTRIAGTARLKDPSVLDALSENERLILCREDNKFDDNAILVLNDQREKLGYIPEKDNIIFARLLDAGKCLGARVRNVERTGSFRSVSIGIYLIDF